VLFSKAVERGLRGPERKGILLSGNIDSRAIAADVARRGEHLPTFTFGEEGCDDARIAAEVAKELDLANTFFPLGPDFLVEGSLEVCWLTDGMYNVFHSHGVSAYEKIAEAWTSFSPEWSRLHSTWTGEGSRKSRARGMTRVTPLGLSAASRKSLHSLS